jgi:hypothetical protein
VCARVFECFYFVYNFFERRRRAAAESGKLQAASCKPREGR